MYKRQALGGLCIGYYSYLCIVYGINEIVFSWVFLLGGMLLLIIGMMTYKRKKHIFSYLPIPLRRIVYLCTTIIIILFLGLQSCILYQGMHTDKQQGDAAIILGAQLHGSSISRLLRYRLERGIQFAEEYPNTYLICLLYTSQITDTSCIRQHCAFSFVLKFPYSFVRYFQLHYNLQSMHYPYKHLDH